MQNVSAIVITNADTGESHVSTCPGAVKFHNPDGGAHNYTTDAGTGSLCVSGPDTDFDALGPVMAGPGSILRRARAGPGCRF